MSKKMVRHRACSYRRWPEMKLPNLEKMLERRGGTLEKWYRHVCESGDRFIVEDDEAPIMLEASYRGDSGLQLQIGFAETADEETSEFTYEAPHVRLIVTLSEGTLEFSSLDFYDDEQIWNDSFGNPAVLAQVVPFDDARR